MVRQNGRALTSSASRTGEGLPPIPPITKGLTDPFSLGPPASPTAGVNVYTKGKGQGNKK